jgi:hypothetical protein
MVIIREIAYTTTLYLFFKVGTSPNSEFNPDLPQQPSTEREGHINYLHHNFIVYSPNPVKECVMILNII